VAPGCTEEILTGASLQSWSDQVKNIQTEVEDWRLKKEQCPAVELKNIVTDQDWRCFSVMYLQSITLITRKPVDFTWYYLDNNIILGYVHIL
jgi:hypothetical protein